VPEGLIMYKIDRKQISPYRSALLQMMDDGALDPATLARDLCGWLSEQDVKEFVQANDLPITDGTDDEDDEENGCQTD
jgi:hypothetical protein